MDDNATLKISPLINVPGLIGVLVDCEGTVTFNVREPVFTENEIMRIAKVAQAHRVAYNRYRLSDFQNERLYYEVFEQLMNK